MAPFWAIRTDDFLAYRNLEAGRGLLNDSNGGIDTLNFAAIAGNIVANLAAGQSITVGGIQWVTLSADPNEFERFFAGDGNDSITGNAAINALHGARGIDTLSGGNGNDDLSGGQGSDRLFGGNHTDAIGGGAGTDYLDGGRNNDILIGGADADRFVFARNYAADSILDFTDNVDTIVLSHTLWVGVLNVAQVITTYAANVSGLGVVLTFATDILTINGLADKTLLLDDLVIV